MKKILVPIDFSEVSTLAAEFAVDLAERSKAEMIFLHSVQFGYYNDYLYGTGLNLQTMIDEVNESLKEKMAEFVKGLKTDLKIETKISGLALLDAVKETVSDEDIGLVIVGTKGSSGWAELMVGSNTERIVRWTDCPVISVASNTTFDSIRKILVPIDLREIQDDFMEKLARLQMLFSADIEFLWVKTPHNIENDELVMQEFSKFVSKYKFKDPSFVITNNVFPSDGILEEAMGLKADMIAMATHARRGISHWLSGSITEDTINHIDIPVWTFKLDKNAENIELSSLKDVDGKAEYKKIEPLTV